MSLGVLVVIAFLQSPVSALAEGKDCDKYASDAVAAWKFSTDNNCGFYGDHWNSALTSHKLWCLDARPEEAQRETDLRDRLIRACQNVATDCIAYAEVAVAQQWANRNHAFYREGQRTRNCEGPEWNYDELAHEHWCLRASPEDRRNETLARALHLSSGCSSSQGGGLSTQPDVKSRERGPIEAPGPVDETKPERGPITAPGPIEGSKLRKGPLVGN